MMRPGPNEGAVLSYIGLRRTIAFGFSWIVKGRVLLGDPQPVVAR